MFDHGIANSTDGVRVDTPSNAVSLAKELHVQFGEFKLFFEEVEENNIHIPHT